MMFSMLYQKKHICRVVIDQAEVGLAPPQDGIPVILIARYNKRRSIICPITPVNQVNNTTDNMLDTLRHNKGFSNPDIWVEYATQHGFNAVNATVLQHCPDCGGSNFSKIGQYIHYSTLVNLHECRGCKLIFSDTLIDPQVIASHFEQAYKDEDYFRDDRVRIFEQIVNLVDHNTQAGGSVLDIGGAKGHLLAAVKQQRPDLKVLLNDLSEEACIYAENTFQLETLCGTIHTLKQANTRFDTIIMSDVLYYIPDLKKVWDQLEELLTADGTLIIRIPNKLPLIRASQFFYRLLSTRKKLALQDRVRFLNPEHIYVFSQKYLVSRLTSIGLSDIKLIPSDLLVHVLPDIIHRVYYGMSKILASTSRGKLITTPGVVIVARKAGNRIATS